MKYLLDTNILVDQIRGKKLIDTEILKAGAGISITVLGELYYGAFKSSNPQKSLFLIEEFIRSLHLSVESLTEEMMYEFAKQKAVLEKEGRRVEDFDLLIAATAKVSQLILVTNNKKHFERIKGLKLFV